MVSPFSHSEAVNIGKDVIPILTRLEGNVQKKTYDGSKCCVINELNSFHLLTKKSQKSVLIEELINRMGGRLMAITISPKFHNNSIEIKGLQ